jgi:lipopolysaccharide transport system permease protein
MKNLNVVGAIRSIIEHRGLLMSLVRREIESKYRATSLGFLWMVIYPLMMIGVYTFVFAGVFGSRWGSGKDWTDFVPMLYCGLIMYSVFAETVGKAPFVIVNNPNYVKKVVFPLELLPLASLLSSIFNASIGFILLLLLTLLFKGSLHWTLLLAPFAFLPLILFTIGISWLFAALGVFFRDIEQLIGILLSVLMFLSPVFYSIESVPPIAHKLLLINPLTYPIDELRNLVLLGNMPQWKLWFINTSLGAIFAWLGLWVFERSRPAFADVV